MTNEKLNMTGLSSAEVERLQEQYGKNELIPQKRTGFMNKVVHIICEPMFLLLIVAAVIYFILGEPGDGAVMLIFVTGVISIDVIQEWKTDRTLNVLKDLSAPGVTVIRDGREQKTASTELVPGDLMMICEGVKIPADGVILTCNDLCVDESSLTGEAEGVWKAAGGCEEQSKDYWRRDCCYAGTLVTLGTAVVKVTKTGPATEYGKIGLHTACAPDEPTLLQRQTGGLVKLCAGIAAVLFALVGVFTYLNIPDHLFKDRMVESILSGVTLAMAMIPEEFPVILTVFLSMGAWRLARKHSLVRRLPSVETLGAVSVLCVDKTGTITMNRMEVQDVWAVDGDERTLMEAAGLGCEIDAYDPMERSILAYCGENGLTKEELFDGELVQEYAFTDKLKMMGHVWRRKDSIVIAVKGSPERILSICDMDIEKREAVYGKLRQMSGEGLRVIAAGVMWPGTEEEIPAAITDCRLTLLGLIGLADPPRPGIMEDIAVCGRAGIRVVMITGDNGGTAASIAEKIGMKGCGQIVTGDMLDNMNEEELRERVKTAGIFSRVVPEHKMRIVKAFKENGDIVAMTGDGVNDAPALKYADIGIAMGKRGSEVSREAADLILMDDNFTTIVETVKDGRRIYDNIRKAVGYIFTIHIPIAAASLLGPFLGIAPAALFLLPLHVVLLELVIDPTCSVVLERQPAEEDIMNRSPRNPEEKLLNAGVLVKSIVQGTVLFAASFGTYYYMLEKDAGNASSARAMGLVVIILGNLFLVQVNSSDHDYAVRSIIRLVKDRVMRLAAAGTAAMIVLILYTPLNNILKLVPLPAGRLLSAAGIAAAAVFWYELVKCVKKRYRRDTTK